MPTFLRGTVHVFTEQDGCEKLASWLLKIKQYLIFWYSERCHVDITAAGSAVPNRQENGVELDKH